ncbi:MFS transporter [Prosthecobacter sp.]|uniref:MFS transporter n=1 Tax=Prosthecobacter sp. TaxID=1965333 RepID=UPI00248757EF|nr:MFS transporter [Prosthecobacter sp.]MDI1314689.1 MFS transporter [Prosthecobacter sp.]
MNDSSSPTLASGWQRGFWSLMVTQFQGAFSDNVLKWLVIYLVIAQKLPEDQLQALVSDSGMYFAIPFLLLSMFGGWMADRFSKRRVMIGVKTMEIGIMIFATYALASGKMGLQLASICLMGVHSAFFAASKYGSLPELVPAAKLSWANGVIEMLTFLAAIFGTLAAAWLAESFAGRPGWAGGILLALAMVGWLMSLGITRVPAASPDKPLRLNFLGDLWREFKWMRTDRDLWRANLGNTGFFFIAVLIQMNLVLYAEQVLHIKPMENSALQVALAIGMAAGSLLAGKLSGDHVEYGLIPLGAFLMAAMGFALGLADISRSVFTICLTLLGIGGGMFIVPLAAVLQHRPPADRKGSVQGAASWLSWVGISAAAVLQKELNTRLGWTPGDIFWFCGACAVVGGIYVTMSRPAALPALLKRWSQGNHG